MKLNRVAWFVLLVLGLGLVTATGGEAAVVTYTDRTLWETALGGAPTFTEDFSSFAADTEFRSVTVDVNGHFTLHQIASTSTFRNLIETSPFVFTDNNGTNHASMFTDFDEPVTVSMVFPFPITAWGGDFYGAANAEKLNLLFAGTTMEMTVDTGFFGFIADTPGTELMFASRTGTGSIPGGEGFGLDNVSARVVPLPGAVWLLGSGLLGLVGVRRKFKK